MNAMRRVVPPEKGPTQLSADMQLAVSRSISRHGSNNQADRSPRRAESKRANSSRGSVSLEFGGLICDDAGLPIRPPARSAVQDLVAILTAHFLSWRINVSLKIEKERTFLM